jgi:hypothetical protein
VTEHVREQCLEFDNLVRFTVAPEGRWETAYMSYRDYFRRDWGDVLGGPDCGLRLCDAQYAGYSGQRCSPCLGALSVSAGGLHHG